MARAVLTNQSARAEWLCAGIIDRALHHWEHVPALDGGPSDRDVDDIDRALHHCGHVPALDGRPGVHDLDFDGSDIDTALPDDDDDVVSFREFSAGIRVAFPVSGESVFLFGPSAEHTFFFFCSEDG